MKPARPIISTTTTTKIILIIVIIIISRSNSCDTWLSCHAPRNKHHNHHHQHNHMQSGNETRALQGRGQRVVTKGSIGGRITIKGCWKRDTSGPRERWRVVRRGVHPAVRSRVRHTYWVDGCTLCWVEVNTLWCVEGCEGEHTVVVSKGAGCIAVLSRDAHCSA